MAKGIHHYINDLPKLQKEILEKSLNGLSEESIADEYGLLVSSVREIRKTGLYYVMTNYENEVKEGL